MCIVCDNSEIGSSFLENWGVAIQALKSCEKSLLLLSDEKNIGTIDSKKEKATDYNRAHKRLVKIRKQLVQVERLRTGQIESVPNKDIKLTRMELAEKLREKKDKNLSINEPFGFDLLDESTIENIKKGIDYSDLKLPKILEDGQ